MRNCDVITPRLTVTLNTGMGVEVWALTELYSLVRLRCDR